MPYITNFTLERIDFTTGILKWTGDANTPIRIYRNGRLMMGPFLTDANREVEFPFEKDEPEAIQIHEEESDGSHSASLVLVDLSPRLRFSRVSGAAYYKVFQKETDTGSERLIDFLPETGISDIIEFDLLRNFNGQGGVWHFFRVESVSDSGAVSSSSSFAVLFRDIPENPSDIDVAGSAGNFTVTVTP